MARQLPQAPIGFRLCHELEGLLTGIAADGMVHEFEAERLRRWRRDASDHDAIHPFDELANRIDLALADGVLTIDECEELLFVVQKYTTVNPHFDAIRTGVQVLMGIMAGVTADAHVSESETAALRRWLDDWSHLQTLWPYDECDALITATLTGQLDEPPVRYLSALVAQFPVAGHLDTSTGEIPPMLIGGVCAVAPAIEFPGRQFVFTGESAKAPRAVMEQHVATRQATHNKRVTKQTDYLVVGSEGNPLWAFSCYGRKIEHAVNLRREGHPVVIVHERDFWDAIQ